jgi:glutathione S-transferase
MSDLIVFGPKQSPFVRPVLMALEEKGVPYRSEELESKSPAHLALHPWGKVPCLRHGDVTLFESQALALYVEELYPTPALRPIDPAGRARVTQWISATVDYFYKHVGAGHVVHYFMHQMRGAPLDRAAIEAGLPAMRDTLAVYERALAGRQWLVGDSLTLADLFLAPMSTFIATTPEGAEAMQASPNFSAWAKRMAQRPSFLATAVS